MPQGYLSSTSRYKNKSEEEKEKLRIQMAKNYYKKTEGKVSRVKKETNFKNGNKNRKYLINEV